MSTVDEIEAAISKLDPQDFIRVRDWLLEQDHRAWDQQLEKDSSTGRLDSLIGEIERDIAAGRTKPLDDVINGS
jgi:hypothetical protein